MKNYAQTINFELVSPAEKLFSEPVDMVVIPGMDGELGIGAGHASFVVALKTGVVRLFQNGNDTPRKIFVSGGFADITGTNCTLLAEEAVNVNDIDVNALSTDLTALNAELTVETDLTVQARIQKKINAVQAKINAAN